MILVIAVGHSFELEIIPVTGTMIVACSVAVLDRFFDPEPNFGNWEEEFFFFQAEDGIRDAATLRNTLLAMGWHRFTTIVAEHEEGKRPIVHCREWYKRYQQRQSWLGGYTA